MSDLTNGLIKTSIGNSVGVLTLQRSTAGVASAALRKALSDKLEALLSNADVSAIVLTGDIGALALDLPLAERQSGEAFPPLAEITRRISLSPKPVVAALRGRVSYAGLELCLAAQARVAQLHTRICLPSLLFGRLCSGAALYGLATSLGPSRSLHLLEHVSDLQVSTPSFAPLFDQIVGQNAVGLAADLARALADGTAQPRSGALLMPDVFQKEIASARTSGLGKRIPPEKTAAINAIEAVQLLPKEAAVDFAEAQDAQLGSTRRASAMTYRRCAKLALMRRDLAADGPKGLNIVGSGAAAQRYARLALRAGKPVAVLPQGEVGFEAFRNALAQGYARENGPRRYGPEQIEAQLANLSALESYDALEGKHWIIEAAANDVREIPDIARQIRQSAGETSLLMLTSGMRNGAGELSHLLGPRTAGLQFHPDSGAGELAEVALRPAELGDTEASLPFLACLRGIGIPTVLQLAQNGLLATRLFTALCQASEEAIALGADPKEVDSALPTRIKPFAAQNAEGFRAQLLRISAFSAPSEDDRAAAMSSALIAAGIGGGPKESAIDASGGISVAASEAIRSWRKRVRPPKSGDRRLTPAQIRAIAQAALYAAAARLYADGAVREPWQIDYVAMAALGLSPINGGPFFETDRLGSLQMRKFFDGFTPLRPEFFDPPHDLDMRIKEGLLYARPTDYEPT